jgi:small ubiquitin-related modifier
MSAEPNGSPAPERKPDEQQAPEAKPEDNQAPKHINIKVKDMNEGETFFKIKPTTKLSKVIEAFCQRHAVDRTGVRFLFEGSRIQDDDTPASLEMDDGDMIEAMIEQTGGGGGEVEEEEEEPQRMTIKVRNADGK